MSTSKKEHQPFDDAWLARHIDMALAVQKPSGPLLALINKVVQTAFKPTLIGAEKIPDQPCLFVSNHSLFALDGLLLMPLFYNTLNRFPRGMGDRFLWQTATEKALLKGGCVLGHPEVCDALMKHGIDLVVFPGGSHEAIKKSSQKYQLQWKQRYGFVRLAAKNGFTIVPLAQVGPDEFYDHLIEGEDIPNTPVGRLLQRIGVINDNTRTDMIPPIPIGSLGTLLPKPQHCYYQFGDPISLSQYQGQELDPQTLHDIRSQVSEQIEAMLANLLVQRSREKSQDGWLRRLLTV